MDAKSAMSVQCRARRAWAQKDGLRYETSACNASHRVLSVKELQITARLATVQESCITARVIKTAHMALHRHLRRKTALIAKYTAAVNATTKT